MKIDSLFRRNLLQTFGSSGLAFVISIFTTPLMTRIFSAEAYGLNGMLTTAATLVSAFGLLGLPIALARAQVEPEQSRLLHSSIQLSVVLTLITAIGVVAVLLVISERPSGLTIFGVGLFPLMVLAYAGQRIADSLTTARGLFKAVAASQLANSVTARSSTLLMGSLLHAGATIMVLGDICGKVLHVVVTLRVGGLRSIWQDICWRPQLSFLRVMLRDYRDFALHSNIATLLPLVTFFGFQVLIGKQLGITAAGQYVLAQSILSLPVSLIAMATAPVVFHRLVEVADETPQQLAGFALKAMLVYLAVGLLTMLPLIFFGPAIFAFVFGEPWRTSGEVATVLSIPQIFAFSLTGLLSLFRVTHQIRAWFRFEMVGTVLLLGGYALLPTPFNLVTAARELAILLFVYQMLMHLGFLWAVRKIGERNT